MYWALCRAYHLQGLPTLSPQRARLAFTVTFFSQGYWTFNSRQIEFRSVWLLIGFHLGLSTFLALPFCLHSVRLGFHIVQLQLRMITYHHFIHSILCSALRLPLSHCCFSVYSRRTYTCTCFAL